MSIEVVTWVFKNSEARLGNRLVLLALADYAHDDGSNAFPSVSSIAAKARMSDRQVQRALKELEAAGDITRAGKHGSGTTIWQVVMRGDNLSGGDIYATETADLSPDPSEPSVNLSALNALPDFDIAQAAREFVRGLNA